VTALRRRSIGPARATCALDQDLVQMVPFQCSIMVLLGIVPPRFSAPLESALRGGMLS
jgi:hypothetical protein